MKSFAIATLGLLFSASLQASVSDVEIVQDETLLPIEGETETEVVPVEDEVLFSCAKGPLGKWQYNLSIEIKEAQATVLQSSMIARYAPLEYSIVRADDYVLPEGKAKFKCTYVKENDPMQYRATIEVHADSILVLQSSMNARFAPLVFDIVKDAAL